MLMRPDADNFWINCMGASVRALDMLAEANDLAGKCGAAELTTGEKR